MFAFGILTDFRTGLFAGSRRLVELADRMNVLQVEALCWCGKRATHNARTEDGVMVVEGEVIVVGDVEERGGPPAEVAYEVLCRQHHRRRLTAARAKRRQPGARAAALRLTGDRVSPRVRAIPALRDLRRPRPRVRDMPPSRDPRHRPARPRRHRSWPCSAPAPRPRPTGPASGRRGW